MFTTHNRKNGDARLKLGLVALCSFELAFYSPFIHIYIFNSYSTIVPFTIILLGQENAQNIYLPAGRSV